MIKYITTVKPKCKVYNIGEYKIRYSLDIETEKSDGSSVLCIMMNPSKADENESDASVNKVIEFFKEDYKIIKICNLIPFFLTNPSEMNQLLEKFQEEKCRNTFYKIMNRNFVTISKEANKL